MVLCDTTVGTECARWHITRIVDILEMWFLICANLQLTETRSSFVVVIGFVKSQRAVPSIDSAPGNEDGSLNTAIVWDLQILLFCPDRQKA